MLKYLLLISIGAVVWWAWRQRAKARTQVPRQETVPERMVACAHCGVHLPLSESVAEGGRYFCCEDHRGIKGK